MKSSNNARSDATLVESHGLRLRMLGMQDGPRKLKLAVPKTPCFVETKKIRR